MSPYSAHVLELEKGTGTSLRSEPVPFSIEAPRREPGGRRAVGPSRFPEARKPSATNPPNPRPEPTDLWHFNPSGWRAVEPFRIAQVANPDPRFFNPGPRFLSGIHHPPPYITPHPPGRTSAARKKLPATMTLPAVPANRRASAIPAAGVAATRGVGSPAFRQAALSLSIEAARGLVV